MTKRRTITGFVAIALLAVDVNRLATDDYDDQSFVYSAKRN
jgi:hypothetical protein